MRKVPCAPNLLRAAPDSLLSEWRPRSVYRSFDLSAQPDQVASARKRIRCLLGAWSHGGEYASAAASPLPGGGAPWPGVPEWSSSTTLFCKGIKRLIVGPNAIFLLRI